MKKYKITIEYENEINADCEEDAVDKFMKELDEDYGLRLDSFIIDRLSVREVV